MLSHHYLLTNNITSQPNSSLSLLALIVSFLVLAKASLCLRPKSVNENIHIACEKAKSKHCSQKGGRDLSAAFISIIKHFKGHWILVLVLLASILSGEARHTNRRGKGLDFDQANRELVLNGEGLNCDPVVVVRDTIFFMLHSLIHGSPKSLCALG